MQWAYFVNLLRAVIHLLIVTFIISFSLKAKSQSIHLDITTTNPSEYKTIDNLSIKTQFVNSLQCKQYLNELIPLLNAKGYIAASIDSIRDKKDSIAIVLFLGKKYIWKDIAISNEDAYLLAQIGINDNWYKSKPINPQLIENVQKRILNYFLNNGYPFATIAFDSIQLLSQESIAAKLSIKKGILYKMDSIRIYGNAKISNNFLYHYLEITPGGLFSLEKLNKINERLLQLPYLQQSDNWTLTMLGGSYLLNLYLAPKKNNQLNVIAGFLPANQQQDGKLLFTGEANIYLKSAFGTGEALALNWQQLQASSPRLNFIFQKPYLFQSNYGVDLGFDLYKKDSAYLNITSKIGLQYLSTAKKTATIALQSFSTNVLTVDTLSVLANKKLPDIVDVRHTNILLEYLFENTNYKPNPIKGFNYNIVLSVGNKRIKKNNSVLQLKKDGFNYASLYDSIKLVSYQFKIKTAFEQYFPVGKQSAIKLAGNVGWLESPNYFRNELFQIGGHKLLRGFDEESIFANKYAVSTFEYRYLLGRNAYINGFADLAITENAVINATNQFIGTGIGLAFEAKQGIINISFAVGKRNDLPFNARQSKIHIGFVSTF